MSNDKKAVVKELRFVAMTHIPALNVSHKLLKELAYSFDLNNSTLQTRYGVIEITPEKIGDSLGLNASRECYPNKIKNKEINEEQKEVIENFKGCTLSQLTKSLIDMSVDGPENQLKFKRIFILFIQKCFLLPTTINKNFSIHMPLILHVDIIQEWNWAAHVFNFLIKSIRGHKLKNKFAVDGCLFVLMIIYFHESTNKNRPVDRILGPPWVQRWTRKKLVKRIESKVKDEMVT
ncbi:hypothetical protein AHAS_Ahas15G0343500 [Arachis hypogaea]